MDDMYLRHLIRRPADAAAGGPARRRAFSRGISLPGAQAEPVGSSARVCFFVVPVLAGFLLLGRPAGAQVPAPGGAKSPPPADIIQKFAAREAEFFEAWKQYSYRQVAEIRVLAVDGRPSSERMRIVSEVVFGDDGTRDIRIVERQGRLRSVIWTDDDDKVINDIQPFALTVNELPQYDVRFEGRERVDELDCFVFSVKPKHIRKGRLYFEGRIWVDDRDLQIVRTVGKPVPQERNTQFPEFETIREVVDGQYWFPTWTHADSILRFPGQRVRIEETITYENYKRFGSKATIQFGPAKPP